MAMKPLNPCPFKVGDIVTWNMAVVNAKEDQVRRDLGRNYGNGPFIVTFITALGTGQHGDEPGIQITYLDGTNIGGGKYPHSFWPGWFKLDHFIMAVKAAKNA